MTSQLPHKIDLHSHFLPDFYQEALKANGHANPDGMPGVPQWSPEVHLALMDRLDISKSIISISTPGTHLVHDNPTLATCLTRQVNQYASNLQKQYPTRFGYFASLPLPDIPASLTEIPLALSEGATGFVLETNHHGHYLGDPIYEPIFSLLDTHHARVFIHPTTPHCPCTSNPSSPTNATPLGSSYPNPMLEFLFDTARAITHLYLSSTMSKYPNIKFVLPHLGGAFPPLLSRFTGFSQLVPGGAALKQEDVIADMNRRVWFDLAGFPFPSQIKGLLATGVKSGRIVYGSDYPWTKGEGVAMLMGRIEEGVKGLWNEEEIEGICWRNAEDFLS